MLVSARLGEVMPAPARASLAMSPASLQSLGPGGGGGGGLRSRTRYIWDNKILYEIVQWKYYFNAEIFHQQFPWNSAH